ncbi:MAG: amidohydrolase family protein [Anaerolineae bacterium]|nr:amidohydrolase family protein [Anaerolineae bacterium]MDW8099214.1 amidohydrolase family protein [Anaerolineae bacterium]
MAELIVDTHLHFWDVDRFTYFWLTPEAGILYRNYLPSHVKPEMNRAGVHWGVFVQASHLLEETYWALELADQHPWIAGVVGWVDLADPWVGDTLDALMRFSRFKGVRHLIHEELDDRWLLRSAVQEGLKALAERGLTYDIVALPRHLPYLPEVIARHPTLNFVLDHMAKPPIASRDLDTWQQYLAAVAAFPNVYCKVSGLITEAKPNARITDELKPVIQVGIELFGFNRLMFGSDWPVCLLASSYTEVVSTTREALGDIGEEDQARFWGENAIQCYGLTNARKEASME